MIVLLDAENRMIFIHLDKTLECDGQMDRRINGLAITAVCIASNADAL